MSQSNIDDGTGTTLSKMKVVIYNTDTQDMQMFDGDNILLKGDTVFITQQGAEDKVARKIIKMKRIPGQTTCFMSVSEIVDKMGAYDGGIDGGAKKRKRKTIKASELGPEFMALMTMNAEIDNRLLQHATRSFKRKHAIDEDTYIDYDYLDVVGDRDAEDNDGAVDGGAKKRKRKTSVKRRKNKKATKKAFNMDVDEYEEMQENVILDKDVDALGDITVDRLAFNDNTVVSGSGNIFDQLGAAISTQRAVIQGGADRMIAQCECDANQIYEDLVNKGAAKYAQGGDKDTDVNKIINDITEPPVDDKNIEKCDKKCEVTTEENNNIDDTVKAVIEATNTQMDAETVVDGGAIALRQQSAKKKKKTTKKSTKKTAKKAEDYLSSSETSEDTSSTDDSISDADTDDSAELSEVSTDNDIAQADETTGTTIMYF